MPYAIGELKDGSSIMFLISKDGETLKSPDDKSVVVRVYPDRVCVVGELENALTFNQPEGGRDIPI